MFKFSKIILISFLLFFSTQTIFAGRYYDSETGRWLTVDPKAGKYPELSPYNYALNNPLKNVDPDGKDPTGITESATVVIGGLAILTALTIHTVEYATNTSYRNQYNSYTASTAHLLNTAVNEISNFVGNIFSSAKSQEESSGNAQENANPYTGPVSKPVIVVDGKGNAIPVKEGEQIKTSPDGKYVDVKDADGKSTGTRIDDGHKPGSKHPDIRSQKPHAHIKGNSNPDGTPWLPIK